MIDKPVCRAVCLIASFLLGLQPRPAADGSGSGPDFGQYLVQFTGSALPADLNARVARLGGSVAGTMSGISVAIVRLPQANAAAFGREPDVAEFLADEPTLPEPAVRLRRPAMPPATFPASSAGPAAASWYPFQWHLRAIGADRAWQAGRFGSEDVRLAILDTGLDPTHPELSGLIDPARSTSFCPGDAAASAQEFPGYPAWTDLHGHGTLVASVAASRGTVVAGMTTRTTLMAVQVTALTGCFSSALLQGIYHAADHGADVINLSVATARSARWHLSAKLLKLYHLAVQYAIGRGVSAVVVAAGNSALDLDHDGDGFQIVCDTPGVICVSATGATSSGPAYVGPFADVDASAFYTNYGSSAIGVAAPGGNLAFDTSGNVVGDSYVFGACASTDREIVNGVLVPGFCSGNGFDVTGGVGTSFSAPHVAGLAALLVAQLGRGHSAQVTAAIMNSADDLGKPGVDPFYGRGRINVPRALGIR